MKKGVRPVGERSRAVVFASVRPACVCFTLSCCLLRLLQYQCLFLRLFPIPSAVASTALTHSLSCGSGVRAELVEKKGGPCHVLFSPPANGSTAAHIRKILFAFFKTFEQLTNPFCTFAQHLIKAVRAAVPTDYAHI